MGIWKRAEKEWNRQDGNSSKKTNKRKQWREHERKKMRKKKMGSHQQISWLWCKTSYSSYRKTRKTWFWVGNGRAWREEMMRERMRQTKKVRKFVL